jgi:acetylglutamate kinase
MTVPEHAAPGQNFTQNPAQHPGLLYLAQSHSAIDALREGFTVVKVGGSIQDVPKQIGQVMAEVATLRCLGANIIVVHGGGKAISAATKAAGIEPRFVSGQRFTDEATLAVAEHVLALQVNAELCAAVAAAGGTPAPLHSLGCCVLEAEPVVTQPGFELGLVGTVTSVRTDVIAALCQAGKIPVIGPIATYNAAAPYKLNINADLAGGAIARALAAKRFILVSDTAGVRTNPADPASAVKVLDRTTITGLIAAKAIDGGMLPKIEACLSVFATSPSCHVMITDGRQPMGLLSAIFEPDAAPATRIVGTK